MTFQWVAHKETSALSWSVYDEQSDLLVADFLKEKQARLIAAAPDMLKVLIAASYALKSYGHGNTATYLALDIAIAVDDVIARATLTTGERNAKS